ncbi:MAG TPA: SRPBCC domain-containing protein [Myxococcota bacterium]
MASKKSAKKKPAKKAAKKSAKKKPPAKKKGAPAKKKAKAKPAKKKARAKKGPAKASAVRAGLAPARVAPKSTAKATTTIVQHVFIQATPQQVYDALVEPSIAAQIVGGECSGAAVVGGAFMQWNDYIHGTHLELVRGERIVQEWTTTEWPKGAAPSRLELQLSGTGGGTELTMTHSNVPSEQAEDYRQGWIDYYWTPMRAHFGG